MRELKQRPYDKLKRGLDVAGSLIGLTLTAPIQLITAALVLAKHGRPVLFRQVRPGLNGELFELVKFRSMRHPNTQLATDADRLTPFGRFIRSTSLDELPSLWNVLKGDMSLVGPRPLLVEYLGLYSSEQARRHEVRPGITGLAQVSGRNAISWGDKFLLDVKYVDERSFLLDAQVLLRTFTQVLRRTGVSAPDHATTPYFTGNSITSDDKTTTDRRDV